MLVFCIRLQYLYQSNALSQTRGADPNLQHQVLEVLDSMQEAGLTVVRTWAFCDGEEWNSLQPTPGKLETPPVLQI